MSSKPKRPTKASGDKPKRNHGGKGQQRRGDDAAWVVSPAIFATIFGIITVAQAMDGHWDVWWVKWICVPSLIGGIAFAFGELLYRYFRRSGKASGAWAICIALAVSGLVVAGYSKLKPAVSLEVWQPPELPENCRDVSIVLGGVGFTFPFDGTNLTRAQPFLQFYKEETPVRPYVKSNRLYVSSGTMMNSSQRLIRIDYEEKQALPIGWDSNCKSNAFEVVDRDTNPVFQIIYVRPNHILLKGVIANTNTVYLVDDHGFRQWDARVTNPFVPPKLTTIFKYPSWRYPGVWAE